MKPVKPRKKIELVLRHETLIVLTSPPLTKVRGGGTISEMPDDIDGLAGGIAGVC